MSFQFKKIPFSLYPVYLLFLSFLLINNGCETSETSMISLQNQGGELESSPTGETTMGGTAGGTTMGETVGGGTAMGGTETGEGVGGETAMGGSMNHPNLGGRPEDETDESCPFSTGPSIQVCGRRLFVNQTEFFIKGINWNPVEVGSNYAVGDPPNFAGRVVSDATLMSAIGLNVVKTYRAILDHTVLDALYEHGIYLVQPVFNYWDANGDGQYSDADLDHINRVINQSKRADGTFHPAILMWYVGNEWNYNRFYNGGWDLNQALDVAEAALDRVKRVDQSIPVSTIWGEVPSREIIQRLDPLVDVWSSNVYRFNRFGQPENQLFLQFAELTERPFYVGEYGCDAYNSNLNRVDQSAQAECNTALASIIANESTLNDGLGIGGFLFEWNDEWWKAGEGSPHVQDSGGSAPGSGPAPDGVFNEEYWGIVEIDRTPRQSYFDLCAVSNPMPLSNPMECPQAESNPIDPVDPPPAQCSPNSNPERLVHILDLRGYSGPINSVRLNGTLWGWDPNGGPVGEDPNGDRIYRIAFEGVPGIDFDYKYRVNGVIEDLTGAGACVRNATEYDFANRRWRVGDPDPVDVFGSCMECR